LARPNISLAARAWLITFFPAITGIIVSLVMATLCLDVVKAVRHQSEILTKMSMVTLFLNEGSEFIEQVFLAQLKLTDDNPLSKKYDPGQSSKALFLLSENDPELRKTVVELREVRKKFHDSIEDWVASRWAYGNSKAWALFRQSAVLTERALQILKKESDVTEAKSSDKANAAFVVVLFLTIVNFCFSFAFLSYFCRRVTTRLSVLRASAASLAAGQPVVASLTEHDEIKQLESNLIDLSRELTLAQERKQDFLAVVSHDLRSPLTSIGVTLEMFNEGVYGDLVPTLATDLKRQQNNLEQLIAFISDMLDLDKIEAGLMQSNQSSVDIVALLKSIREDLSDFGRSRNKIIDLIADEKSIASYCDRDKMTTAIKRIVMACLSDTPGPVRLKVDSVSRSGKLLVSIETSVRSLQLISQKDVFDRFSVTSQSSTIFQKHRHALALAQGLIKLSDGETQFVTQPGMIRFCIWLNKAKRAIDDAD
jgi:signal transduction histidine kinase